MMMTINCQFSGSLLATTLVGLSACSAPNVKEPVDSSSTTAATVARRQCGNDPSYQIAGKTYQVLPTAEGYSEQGTAAWYGAEYQGTETAGCEVFDMYSYSAAHKTLPLPSFAKVTNQANGKHIIVRINDRGPFDSNDLIQLSFAAANALGISARSGSPVLVEAISPQQVPPEALIARPSNARKAAQAQSLETSKGYYVVAGTSADQNEALDLFVRLTAMGLGKTEMATAQQDGQVMHQVRVGPLYNQDQIDNVKDTLESNGLASFKMVAR
ncbi:MAG: septal ring lytic transglycosylase RlpA family protein [Thiothrix sp.]